MSKLASLSGFHGLARPGRFGRQDGAPGVTIAERADLGLATVAARKGRDEALGVRVRKVYGAALPSGPSLAQGKGVTFIGTGPGQWFALSAKFKNEALAGELAGKLEGLASVSDQSSGRAVLNLRGPHVRDVLAKGLAIDLDPLVFPPDGAVTSTISHIGVQLWSGDAGGYDIAVSRSMAEGFWRWLTASAAEYGYEVAEGQTRKTA